MFAISDAKVNPLCCLECKGDMHVIAFMEEPDAE